MGLRQIAQQKAKTSFGLEVPWQFAGTPTSGVGGTYAGKVALGSLLQDTTTGKLYSVTAATGGATPSVTYTLIGAQV
jgi:hypothetical protein